MGHGWSYERECACLIGSDVGRVKFTTTSTGLGFRYTGLVHGNSMGCTKECEASEAYDMRGGSRSESSHWRVDHVVGSGTCVFSGTSTCLLL